VRPDAKINCVNYCKNILEQGLLSAIHVSRTTTSWSSRTQCLHTVHNSLSLRPSCVPMCLSSLN